MHKYTLVSILMHEGGARKITFTVYKILQIDGGHYFNYIHDIKDNTWRYYSDITIESRGESQIMEEAFGKYFFKK